MPSNIVILIDLNSFPCYTATNSKCAEWMAANSIFDKSSQESEEHSPEGESFDEFLLRHCKWIQDYVLTLLSKEATRNNELDFSDYLWSYSFYNSAKDLPTKYGKRFHAVDLPSFETFEKHLLEELKNSYAQNKICPTVNKMSCLSSVIKNMIGGDLPWTEPTIRSDEDTKNNKHNRNILYAMLRVPRSEKEGLTFVDDVSVLAKSQNFINTLLPRAFFKEFHNRFRIQLNFVDMWFAHGDVVKGDGSWNEEYCAPIPKVLHYLNTGRIIPLTKTDFGPPGLPSYVSLLKLSLKANTSPRGNESKKMAGMLKSNSQKSLKISPDTEDSFPHSLISGTTARSSNAHKSQEFLQNNGSRGSTFKPFIKTEPLDTYNYDQGKESPRRKKLKRKRKPVKMEVKREVESNESSDDDKKYHRNYEADVKPKSKLRPTDRRAKGRLDHPNINRSREEINPAALWTRPNGKKQPLTAPSKLVTSVPASRGHAFLAKVRQGNSKTDYVENLLKSDEKCSKKTAAEKQRSAQREASLKDMKLRLSSYLQNITLEKHAPEEEVVETMTQKISVFKDMIIINSKLSDMDLVSLAQGLVNVLTCTLRQYDSVTDIKVALEKILLVSYETLNISIMDHKYNSADSCFAYFRCQLQILLKFELAWMWPGNDEETQLIRDDVLKLLNLISAYRRDPPIQDFVVNILTEAYAEVQGSLLAAIFRGLAIPLPKKMRNMMSPAANDKNFPDDMSQASSIDSSLSQLDSISVAKSHSQSYLQNRQSQSVRVKPSLRNASYLSLGNPKKQIMVPVPKFSRSHKLKNDSAKKKLALAVARSSPKRVRRNLFDVKKHDKEDLKTLMALATTSRFSRSPSLKFRSPSSFKSRSPRSPAYARGLRSKRRLHMDDAMDITPIGVASPDMFSNSGILCPESPATPNSAYYKRSRMSTSFGSTEKNIIQESPEVAKTKCENSGRPLRRVDSLSFYSTKHSSEKAIAWEKSGAKMMAARIKDSVDLTQSLLLNDLEFINGSPSGKVEQHQAKNSQVDDQERERYPSQSPEVGVGRNINKSSEEGSQVSQVSQLGYLGLVESPCANSSQSELELEKPCCSKSLSSNPFLFEVSPNNISPNIEALIRSENFPLSSMILNQRNSNKQAPCTSILETPTKKVQFSFTETLNTPSPNRSLSTTPKSILK